MRLQRSGSKWQETCSIFQRLYLSNSSNKEYSHFTTSWPWIAKSEFVKHVPTMWLKSPRLHLWINRLLNFQRSTIDSWRISTQDSLEVQLSKTSVHSSQLSRMVKTLTRRLSTFTSTQRKQALIKTCATTPLSTFQPLCWYLVQMTGLVSSHCTTSWPRSTIQG